MRKAPQLVALGWMVITIYRVVLFLMGGMKVEWWAWPYAVCETFGIFVSSYFIRYRQTRLPAILTLGMLTLSNLWFNQMELIRILSATQLLPPESNFLNFSYESLVWAMQISAVVLGAIPTLAFAGLAWIQSGAESVTITKNQPRQSKIGLAIAAFWQKRFPEKKTSRIFASRSDVPLLENSESGKNGLRWNELTEGQKEEIAGMTVKQIISRYGTTARTARYWKSWMRNGN